MHHFDQVEFASYSIQLPRYYGRSSYSLLVQYLEVKMHQTYHVVEGFTSVVYHFTSLNSRLLTFNDHFDDQIIYNEHLIQVLGLKAIVTLLLSHDDSTCHMRAIALQFNVDGNGSHIALEHMYF